jgi:geranylgeranyl diphosphate synthase type I
MRVLANLAVSHRGDGEIPLEKRLRLQILIDENCLRLIEGQYLDISYEHRLDVGVSDYLDMIEMKTAALIACSVEAGAVLGTDDEAVIEGLRYFGNNLGLAFQIRDDILGIWGCQEMTGKLAGSDIRDRKKTIPVVYALEKAEGGLRRELADIYQNGTLEDVAEATVLRVLEAVDAGSHSQKMVETYSRKALDTIDRLPLVPSAREEFRELVYFLLERDF